MNDDNDSLIVHVIICGMKSGDSLESFMILIDSIITNVPMGLLHDLAILRQTARATPRALQDFICPPREVVPRPSALARVGTTREGVFGSCARMTSHAWVIL